MKEYDLLVFKRKGFVSGILGAILKHFEKDWDGWGWHVGIVWGLHDRGGWLVLESLGGGPEINWYSEDYLRNCTRSYTWLDDKPSNWKITAFLPDHIGKKYDVAVYFWTALQYLIRHYFNRRIPRLLDDRYTCWELAAEFFEAMGKPIHSKYDCPMLPDMLDVIE